MIRIFSFICLSNVALSLCTGDGCVEIFCCESLSKINLTLKKKISYQILCDKSHHTQIEYRKELSIKRGFIDAYNSTHTLLYAPVLLTFSLTAFLLTLICYLTTYSWIAISLLLEY